MPRQPAVPKYRFGKWRAHQKEMLSEFQRFNCAVMHRRAGKTYVACAKLIAEAMASEHRNGVYHYLAGTHSQAKDIAFEMIARMTQPTGWVEPKVGDLSFRFRHGPIIRLRGVEAAERLRGQLSDGMVCDEAQLYPLSTWNYILRPMLIDRKGWALITGTPAGPGNFLAWAHDQEGWAQFIYPVSETKTIEKRELADLRRTMSAEAWAQEMECSFAVALQGAYYARAMEQLKRAGRITRVMHDPAHPVIAALDLGWSDALSVWYVQEVGNAVHHLRYEEHHYLSLPELVEHWQGLPFPITAAILPHDARVTELGTGKSRLEILQGLGVKCQIAPSLRVHDGIEAVRLQLARSWFDKDGCEEGLQALDSYRSEWREHNRVMAPRPLHDWASHGADALRYLALTLPQIGPSLRGGWEPLGKVQETSRTRAFKSQRRT